MHLPSTVAMLLLLTAMLGCGESAPTKLRVAVTTSTQNSGLLDVLEPAIEKESGLDLEVIAVGSGRALELGRRGDVDAIWVHDRSAEDQFVAQGHGVDRRDVMWNEFVIVGPAEDPAAVRGFRDAAAALMAIHDSGSTFISRGDDSGTHRRELLLTGAVSSKPFEPSSTYLVAGVGMGKTLLLANEKNAYTLTDRGTWLAYRDKLELVELVRGDLALRNPYGAIAVNPARYPHVQHQGAQRFLDFLTGEQGQKLIREFRVKEEQLFHAMREGS